MITIRLLISVSIELSLPGVLPKKSGAQAMSCSKPKTPLVDPSAMPHWFRWSSQSVRLWQIAVSREKPKPRNGLMKPSARAGTTLELINVSAMATMRYGFIAPFYAPALAITTCTERRSTRFSSSVIDDHVSGRIDPAYARSCNGAFHRQLRCKTICNEMSARVSAQYKASEIM